METSSSPAVHACTLSDILKLLEAQLGIRLLQEETLGSTAGVEAILADRGRYETGQSRYPGLSHGSQHGVSLC